MSRTPAIALGDINLNARAFEDLIIRPTNGRIAVGHGVDHAAMWGPVTLLSVRRLLAGGSDHPPILYTFIIDGRPVRVIAWNVYVGQAPTAVQQRLENLTTLYMPHVVVLFEAYRCRRVLGHIDNYRRHQRVTPGEARGLAVLVRKDVAILRRGWLRMAISWVGPVHGHAKPPRTYPRLRLRTAGGVTFRILGLHLPTGGVKGRNKRAVLETIKRVQAWVGTR